MNLTTLTITAVILVMIGLDVNQATPEARIPRTFGTSSNVSNYLVLNMTLFGSCKTFEWDKDSQ